MYKNSHRTEFTFSALASVILFSSALLTKENNNAKNNMSIVFYCTVCMLVCVYTHVCICIWIMRVYAVPYCGHLFGCLSHVHEQQKRQRIVQKTKSK